MARKIQMVVEMTVADRADDGIVKEGVVALLNTPAMNVMAMHSRCKPRVKSVVRLAEVKAPRNG